MRIPSLIGMQGRLCAEKHLLTRFLAYVQARSY